MIHLLAAGVVMCTQALLPAADCKTDGEVDADRFIEQILMVSGSPGGVWLPQGQSIPATVQNSAQTFCSNLVPGLALKAVPVYKFTDSTDKTDIGTYYACVRAPTS